jgi:hypothetical protein
MSTSWFGKCACCIPTEFQFWQVRITRSGSQTQDRTDMENARTWLNAFDFDSISWPNDYRDRANYSWDNTTDTASFDSWASDDEPRYRSLAQIGGSESLWVLTRYRIDFGDTAFDACDLVYLDEYFPLPETWTLEDCSGRSVSGIVYKDAPAIPATGTNVSRFDHIHWATAITVTGVPYASCSSCDFDP